MGLKFRAKAWLSACLLLFMAGAAFAVDEYVSDVYKEIDIVFLNKSDRALQKVLRANLDDKYYYLMENYSKKKVRRLIIDEDYEFAMLAIYVIIDTNIDGDFEDDEAVDMYSTISEAYEIQQQAAVARQEAEKKAAEKKEQENAKIRSKVETDYVVVNQGGRQVYLSGKDERLSSYRWRANFNMATLGHIMDVATDQQGMNYGVSADVLYEYVMQTMTVGADLFADFQFLSLGFNGIELPMLANLELAPKLAFKPLGQKLFVRFGFASMTPFKSKTTVNTSGLYDNFLTPLVGIQLGDLSIGKAFLTVGADWYAGHLFKTDLNAAAGARISASIPFAELEKVKLNFNFGARDYIFVKDSGIENRVSAIIGFGVENVIR